MGCVCACVLTYHSSSCPTVEDKKRLLCAQALASLRVLKQVTSAVIQVAIAETCRRQVVKYHD